MVGFATYRTLNAIGIKHEQIKSFAECLACEDRKGCYYHGCAFRSVLPPREPVDVEALLALHGSICKGHTVLLGKAIAEQQTLAEHRARGGGVSAITGTPYFSSTRKDLSPEQLRQHCVDVLCERVCDRSFDFALPAITTGG